MATKKEQEKEERKLARREAKGRIRDYIKSLADGEPIKADLLLIIGTGVRGRAAVPSINTKIKEALIEAGETGMTGLNLYKKFQVGMPEMARKIKLFLKGEADNRVWVESSRNDKDELVYTVVGLGADVPEGWDGYIPADVEAL